MIPDRFTRIYCAILLLACVFGGTLGLASIL